MAGQQPLIHAATPPVDRAQTATLDITATSNEPPVKDNGDVEIKRKGLDPRIVRARAELGAKGPDTVHTVTAKASGKSGLTTVAIFYLPVPYGQTNDDDDDSKPAEDCKQKPLI